MADDSRQAGGGLPSIAPERDQVASYRRSGRPPPPRQSNFNGILLFVIVVMGIMMAVGGYILYEVQRKLDDANQLLAQTGANLGDLESRLSATGSDVSQSFQDLHDQVKKNFSEIDKLWAVSYRQNKPDIQQNVRAIEKLQLDLEGRLAVIDSALQAMQGQLATTLKEMRGGRDQLRENREALLRELTQLRSLTQEQATLMEATRRQANSLDIKMMEVQADIEAINGFRASFNERLLRLEQR